MLRAIPHNSKCRYGERGAAAAKPKAQIILCAAKVSAASGGCSEPKQGQRSQSARGFCPEARCGYRNPTLSSILATQMPCRTPSRSEALRSATAACGGSWRGDPPERCLSRKAGIMRCCSKDCSPLSGGFAGRGLAPSAGRRGHRPLQHRRARQEGTDENFHEKHRFSVNYCDSNHTALYLLKKSGITEASKMNKVCAVNSVPQNRRSDNEKSF